MEMSIKNTECIFYQVIDKDTDKTISYCTYANDETGEYVIIKTDENGRVLIDEKGSIIKEQKKGNIKIERKT